eukprot:4893225-Prorocentrum_lima.AAC.1
MGRCQTLVKAPQAGKAAGLDQLSSSMIGAVAGKLLPQDYPILRKAALGKNEPKHWRDGAVALIPNKGQLEESR